MKAAPICIVLFVMILSGCERRSPALGSASFGNANGKSGWLMTRDGKLLAAILINNTAGPTSISAGTTSTGAKGLIAADPPAQPVKFEFKTTDGLTGSATIGPAKFDLSGGSLFLISPTTPPQVVQINKHLSDVTPSPDALIKFVAADPQASPFLNIATQPAR